MATVSLLAHTPEPQRVIAAAAKLCYSPSGIDGLFGDLDEKKSADFIEKLMTMGHESPLEHASFTFGIEGVSRTLLAQITRHRIASFSVQSQRYVAENDFESVLPPAIAANKQAREQFEQAMEDANAHYNKIADTLQREYERDLSESGVPVARARSAAKKRAIEDARFVLPGACDTKMMMTMNARSLLNFFRLRCCERAQWEIRALAEQMLCLVYPVAPALFAGAGPGCVAGACPEGAMSCGGAAAVRRHFAQLKGEEIDGNPIGY